MGLESSPDETQNLDETQDENEDTPPEQNAAQGPETEVTNDDQLPRRSARYALRTRGSKCAKRADRLENDHDVSDRLPSQGPDTRTASLKRTSSTSHTKSSNASKKIKTEPSLETEQAEEAPVQVWTSLGDGDDGDELQVLDDVAAPHARAGQTGQRLPWNNYKQGEERLSLPDLHVELAKAKVELFEKRIARQEGSGASFKG